MEVRYASNSRDFATFTTQRIREEFLVQNMFVSGEMPLVYSHYDRLIIGGACPTAPLALGGGKALGTEYFLERREMGVINVGQPGSITADGQTYELNNTDCLYIGKGVKEVSFDSKDAANPAKFYILSGPAHADHPTTLCTMQDANTLELGSTAEANERQLNQYIHAGGVQSCNLVMGITVIKPGSVWNSMPATPMTGAWKPISISTCPKTPS